MHSQFNPDSLERVPSSVSEAMTEWLADLGRSGKAASTLRTYRVLLRNFPDGPLLEINRSLCGAFIDDLVAHRSLATAATSFGALSSFLKYCCARSWLAVSPLAGMPCPTPKPPAQRILTSNELRRLWEHADEDRDRLLLLLLTTGPIRVNELVHIRWCDVDVDAGTVRLLWTKGGHPRTLSASSGLLALLSEQTTKRKPSDRLMPVTTEAVRQRLARLGKRAKVAGVHPHCFRHSWSVKWMLETQDAMSLKYLGGWRSDAMVAHYSRAALEQSAVVKARGVNLQMIP